MEEFSFLRIEQMLRSGRVALRKLARKATIVEAQTVAQQIDQLSNIINTLMEIRCGGHDDGR
jgi:hypothetical protein